MTRHVVKLTDVPWEYTEPRHKQHYHRPYSQHPGTAMSSAPPQDQETSNDQEEGTE